MRALFLITILATVAWLGSSTPVDPRRQLINRPTRDMMLRIARSAPIKGREEYHIKGGRPRTTEPPVRKGEYWCGNRICRLQPGEVPAGCNGVCQYAIDPFPYPHIQD